MSEMQERPDIELLRDYAADGNEASFREIVGRYTDLVYSAALRQVTSPDLAGDVAQGVFVDLARKSKHIADQLPLNASLVGWLYRSTRFAVLNHLRADRRRATHERQAMEQLLTDSAPAQDWERIRPLLDQAMADLSDDDRDALLLRYFKNQDFRTVGHTLGLSDDAAQKRVSRAVERLREFFSKRGVTIGATGLVVILSANAVQSAPLALVATISTAAILAGTTVHTSTALAATKAIAMTTLQKTILVATIAVLAGAGAYEARQSSQLRAEVETLHKQQAPLIAQIQQLQRDHDTAANELAAWATENAHLKSNQNKAELLTLRSQVAQFEATANDPVDSSAKAWLGRVNKLKARLEASPGAKIPELQFLTEEDWLNATRGKLETEIDYRRALASLRSAGESKIADSLHQALQAYSEANNNQFPTDLQQLQSYFNSPMDNAILDRWQIVPVKDNGFGGDSQITEKTTPDEMFDHRITIGTYGYGSTSDFLGFEGKQIGLSAVYTAYKSVNNGKNPSDPALLLPYATTPEQKALIQKMAERDALQK